MSPPSCKPNSQRGYYHGNTSHLTRGLHYKTVQAAEGASCSRNVGSPLPIPRWIERPRVHPVAAATPSTPPQASRVAPGHQYANLVKWEMHARSGFQAGGTGTPSGRGEGQHVHRPRALRGDVPFTASSMLLGSGRPESGATMHTLRPTRYHASDGNCAINIARGTSLSKYPNAGRAVDEAHPAMQHIPSHEDGHERYADIEQGLLRSLHVAPQSSPLPCFRHGPFLRP